MSERVNRIRQCDELWQQGFRIDHIAKTVGVTGKTVSRYLYEARRERDEPLRRKYPRRRQLIGYAGRPTEASSEEWGAA